MKIGITSDHGGYKLKTKLIKYLNKKYEVIDFGTDSENSVDYPDYAIKLGKSISNKEIDYGIAICKTGIGMAIALNKVKGVMCAKLNNKKDAICARKHNGANAISMSGMTSFFKAKCLVNNFFGESIELEERHMRRINKIRSYEDAS